MSRTTVSFSGGKMDTMDFDRDSFVGNNDDSLHSSPPVDTKNPLDAQLVISPQSRLVVNETVYYQVRQEPPVAVGSQFTRWLHTDEAIYAPPRTHKVEQEWRVIDTGWVKTPSLLLIRNLAVKNQMTGENPSDALQVLEISFREGDAKQEGDAFDEGVGMWARAKVPSRESLRIADALLLPGESMRFTPVDASSIAVRCRKGEGSFSITAVP